MTTDAIVVGGGFYGLRIALELGQRPGAGTILVLEERDVVMSRASLVNQARVHNGYHYPRSILTGYRSRSGSERFAEEFPDAIDRSFRHYYAIAARSSKTSSRQFVEFAHRIHAPIEPAPPEITARFDRRLVDQVYEVEEPAFNALMVRETLLDRIRATGRIEVRTGVRVERVAAAGGSVAVETSSGVETAPLVISATYANLNRLNEASGFASFPLQHELAEMALVSMSASWRDAAVTVMDGPFFSAMPFPSRGLHTLSHVRYTPHARWIDDGSAGWDPGSASDHVSAFGRMRADAGRFIPEFRSLESTESIWETKTVLAHRDQTDSRPIFFRRDHGVRGYVCVMGGKLDNVYDVLDELVAIK